MHAHTNIHACTHMHLSTYHINTHDTHKTHTHMHTNTHTYVHTDIDINAYVPTYVTGPGKTGYIYT